VGVPASLRWLDTGRLVTPSRPRGGL